MDLKSYLIPDEIIATESISDTMSNATIIGIILVGLGVTISNWRKQKAFNEKMSTLFGGKAETERRQRLRKKYGEKIVVDPVKLRKSIEFDMITIAKKINLNHNLCTQWADEYLQYLREDLYKDKEIPSHALQNCEDIKTSPCSIKPWYCGSNYNWAWAISDLDQIPNNWICDEHLFEIYLNALNIKYADEIEYEILTKFSQIGDGDVSVIGSTYNPSFLKPREKLISAAEYFKQH